MLRRLYCLLLHLHPLRFRKRFGEEMLSIFDAAANDANRVSLITDAVFSLLRQWALRSEYRHAPAEAAHCSADGIPVLYTFGDYKPSIRSFIAGGTFAAVLFCAVWLTSRYTWAHPALMRWFPSEPKSDFVGAEPLDPRMPMDILSQYTGVYTASGAKRLVASVTAEDGRLTIQITGEPKTRLVWVNGIAFKFLGSKTDWVRFDWGTFVRNQQRVAIHLLTVCQAGHCVTTHLNTKQFGVGSTVETTGLGGQSGHSGAAKRSEALRRKI